MKKIKKIFLIRKNQSDYCQLKDMSQYLIKYVLLMEDPDFFEHKGINVRTIKAAIENNLQGGIFAGGSTITQQLVKNIFFRFERSYSRKIKEAFIARSFEKALSKNEILELYLNTIYYDNGQYGIINACSFYFDKKPSELTCNQACFLAGILPIVGIYNPLYHPEDYLRYRLRKLDALYSQGKLNEEEYHEIMRHHADCLDEELCQPSALTEKYNDVGPMINERFGPGCAESLLDAANEY